MKGKDVGNDGVKIASFIFDEASGLTGVVEEVKDGLVRYSIRIFGDTRHRYRWTLIDNITVLLDHLPTDESDAKDRMVLDLLDHAPNFKQEADGTVYWYDNVTDSTYEVGVTLGAELNA